MKKRIILYSVPNLSKVSGGPKTRINSFAKVILQDSNNSFIEGKAFDKLKKTLKAKKADLLYIESSTNRISLIDFLCIIILKIISKKTIVYIRDVYIQVFTEKYKKGRPFITKIFNKISNLFYVLIAKKLAFPTIEMGEVFFKKYPKLLNKEYFALPPGSYNVEYNKTENIKNRTINKLSNIHFLYLGGTSYKYSGFEDFLKIAKELHNKYRFTILSSDNIDNLIEKYNLKDKINKLSLKHEEVIKFFEEESVSFIIHSRPHNLYDDITYPIKIMDCISCGVPFISVMHKPIVSLVGENYNFFVDAITSTNIEKLLMNNIEKEYSNTLQLFLNIKEKVDYSNLAKMLIKNIN